MDPTTHRLIPYPTLDVAQLPTSILHVGVFAGFLREHLHLPFHDLGPIQTVRKTGSTFRSATSNRCRTASSAVSRSCAEGGSNRYQMHARANGSEDVGPWNRNRRAGSATLTNATLVYKTIMVKSCSEGPANGLRPKTGMGMSTRMSLPNPPFGRFHQSYLRKQIRIAICQIRAPFPRGVQHHSLRRAAAKIYGLTPHLLSRSQMDRLHLRVAVERKPLSYILA